MDHFDSNHNPLVSDDPTLWDELLTAIGPASLLVAIESRMSTRLSQLHPAEDILQEALLHAWRDRASCQWRGLKPFRSWLLSIIDNRIREAADHSGALKRGGGQRPQSIHRGSSDRSGVGPPMPAVTTTPSRIAIYKEQAAAMLVALTALPEELRDVVRLRLFEQMPVEQVADQLNLGVAAVRHRFRKGAEMYHRRLVSEFTIRPRSIPPDSAQQTTADSSPME